MKRRTGIAALFLMLCLLAAVSGCGGDTREESAPPATTEAPAPQRSADSLELDGSPLGPVWLLEDNPCLALTSLTELWGLTAEEPEPGLLRLTGEGESWTLRAGSAEATAADGARRELHGPVRQTAEGDWYLPLSALEALWDRKTVYDPDGAVLRCLRLEPGPEILLRAENGKPGSLIGGVPALSAWDLAELVSGSAEQDSADDGVPTLTLRAGERVLCFRAGSVQARLDDAPLALPAPALQEGENWYLPAGPAAEALGFAALRFPGGERIELWPRQTGPALWLEGRGLGPTLCLDGVPCADLEALAGAVGGSLQQEGDALRLQAGEHSLVFRLGETVCSADGGELILPVPALPVEDACYVPVLPFAEALELPAAEGEALVFSRMEPRETQLWIDGCSTPAWGLEEGPLCVRLSDIPGLTAEVPTETPEDPTETPEAPTETPEAPTEAESPEAPADSQAAPDNSVCLSVFGKRLLLTGGSARAELDGEALELPAPVYAAGADWYAPASGLLQALGLSELEDPDYDQIYYTRVVRHDSLAPGCKVPVLMYHAVSDYVWGIPELFVSPSRLEEQLQALRDGGYTTVTFEDLDRIEEIEKPVMLTFDDGYDDNYKELFPLLQKYGAKATVFVIVNDLGKSHKLKKDQVREMSESGLVSIQSHTMSHNYLSWMGESELRYEHSASRLALARITGKAPFVMCYPTGKNSAASRAVTAEYYEYGLCMGGPCYVTGEAPYSICRYYISRYTSLESFLNYVSGEAEP